MNFEEYAGKAVLRTAGIQTPKGALANTVDQAIAIARELGPCVIKAQVPAGKRGKAGGIQLASNEDEVAQHTADILQMQIAGYDVEKVLIEELSQIEQEYYAAVMNDPESKGPIMLFSAAGGMDIEEIAEKHPDQLRRQIINIRQGLTETDALQFIDGLDFKAEPARVSEVLCRLYQAYSDNDAELMEINPLVLLNNGSVIALDCKFVLEDSSIVRQTELAVSGAPDKLTGLELAAKEIDLKLVELDGDIGVIANGAGLTMTTMDVVSHYGGRPANFLEIGGEAYTKATDALNLLLQKPGLNSLVIIFCGAFARTDVMTEGIINAWEELKPDLPVFFSIHGTGSRSAKKMLAERLGMQAYPLMDDAIKAAIAVKPSGSAL